MKLGVCLFTDSLEPSGVGEHMLTLGAALRGQYRMSFICPPSAAGWPLLERAAALGLEARPLALRGVRGQPWAHGRLCTWLVRRDVAIFHVHAGVGWEGHAAVRAARAAGVPAVMRTEHLPDVITAPSLRARYAEMAAGVDRLICVSEAVRASFLRAGVPAGKVRLVRNGICPVPCSADRRSVRACLGLPEEAHVILTVARLARQKGHRALLDAATTVLTRAPDARFLWVGDGPLERTLGEAVRRRGLDGCVRLLGRRADVPDLLAAADLFVLPSLFEGLPLVILEAMAAGLPVIATRVCGTEEAVLDGVTGGLVPAGDGAALAGAILAVLTDPALAARWGAAGRRRLEEDFTAVRMARQTAALYEEVLAERRVAAGLPRLHIAERMDTARGAGAPPTMSMVAGG